MTTTRPGVLNVRAKTSAVVDHHNDDARPGKPLYLLIPGGLIALAAIGLIIYIIYTTWFKNDMPSSQGLGLIALLAPFYIGGVFLFSYGYELYDMKKTLKLTAIVVFVTVSFVVIIAVLFALAGLSGDKSSGSSSKSSSSSSSDGGGKSAVASPAISSSSTSYASHDSGVGDLAAAVFLSNAGSTHTVTHEVIREVPVAPPPPQPITCPFCGKSYLPAENKFTCPGCGAATPKDLLPQDQNEIRND
jgi:hypothetical protein